MNKTLNRAQFLKVAGAAAGMAALAGAGTALADVALAGQYGNPDLVRTYCVNAGPTCEWIIAPAEEGGLSGEPLDEWGFASPNNGNEM